MKKRLFQWLGMAVVLGLLISACGLIKLPFTATKTPTTAENEPYEITGSFTVTNDFVIAIYAVEHAVVLADMHGFVVRNKEWELPIDSQVLGYMHADLENLSGTYELSLPLHPRGTFNDVDNDDQQNAGVQIFAVAYSPNIAGGPFSEGDDRSFGWPTYLASVVTDSENEDEVIGGNLVVWAADDMQEFPTHFGEDGELFTADDPVGKIPAGYSIVNLDQEPFVVTQEPQPTLMLYEPKEFELKDYSDLSYTEAFDNMFEYIRTNYAFNGIEGKQPDWDSLYTELKPDVEAAEQSQDPKAFYMALRDYTWAFKDGHVGLSGGDVGDQVFAEETAGGYGFAIRELDDGRVIVIYILEDGPAAQAGMQVGAEVTQFNDKPIKDAIGGVAALAAPFSTPTSERYQQARYLLRAPLGTQAKVTFVNPGGASKTTTLEAVAERQSHSYTSVYRGSDPNALPVEFQVLASGVGYVKINSYYDDLNLIVRLFERGLKTFEANQVPGIIIDMRQNSGGNPLGLAGFLTDQEILLGQGESYSEKTGQFETEGIRDKVLPNQEQYRFDKIALLVGLACASACDEEAYSFSQVPGVVVVGQYPTTGIFADVARGQFALPEGMSLQVPTTRFTLPDGSLFLEGTGVQPTLRVPIDETTVLSQEDEVLKSAVRAVLQPLGAGITPSGPPTIGDAAASEAALQASAKYLEDKAAEQYDKLSQAGQTYTYTVSLSESETLIWTNGWCAKTEETLKDNYKHIKLKFVLDSQEVSLDQLAILESPSGGNLCRMYYTALSEWPGGEHHLSVDVTFDKVINDGTTDYPAGTHTYEYTVYVKP